jgi:dienelactone hydrolase
MRTFSFLFVQVVLLITGDLFAQDNFKPRFGRMVSIKTAKGPEVRLFEAKPGKWDGALILMFHDINGFNGSILHSAEQLATETGAVVLVPDLLDRRSASDTAAMRRLLSEVDDSRVTDIIKSCVDYGGKFSRIQTIGWGRLGGTYSLRALMMSGDRGYGGVIYQGKVISDTTLLKAIEGPVLYFQGNRDKLIQSASVADFQKSMLALSKSLDIVVVDAAHGYALRGQPAFKPELAEISRKQARDFIRKNFQAPPRRRAPAGGPDKE